MLRCHCRATAGLGGPSLPISIFTDTTTLWEFAIQPVSSLPSRVTTRTSRAAIHKSVIQFTGKNRMQRFQFPATPRGFGLGGTVSLDIVTSPPLRPGACLYPPKSYRSLRFHKTIVRSLALVSVGSRGGGEFRRSAHTFDLRRTCHTEVMESSSGNSTP